MVAVQVGHHHRVDRARVDPLGLQRDEAGSPAVHQQRLPGCGQPDARLQPPAAPAGVPTAHELHLHDSIVAQPRWSVPRWSPHSGHVNKCRGSYQSNLPTWESFTGPRTLATTSEERPTLLRTSPLRGRSVRLPRPFEGAACGFTTVKGPPSPSNPGVWSSPPRNRQCSRWLFPARGYLTST